MRRILFVPGYRGHPSSRARSRWIGTFWSPARNTVGVFGMAVFGHCFAVIVAGPKSVRDA